MHHGVAGDDAEWRINSETSRPKGISQAPVAMACAKEGVPKAWPRQKEVNETSEHAGEDPLNRCIAAERGSTNHQEGQRVPSPMRQAALGRAQRVASPDVGMRDTRDERRDSNEHGGRPRAMGGKACAEAFVQRRCDGVRHTGSRHSRHSCGSTLMRRLAAGRRSTNPRRPPRAQLRTKGDSEAKHEADRTPMQASAPDRVGPNNSISCAYRHPPGIDCLTRPWPIRRWGNRGCA